MGEAIKNKEVEQQLELAKKEGANLLMPSMQIAGLSEFHAPVIEKVFANVDTKDGGDLYPHGDGKKFRPTKQLLMKLSVCAGVIWSPSESKRIDNGADRNYIAYRAVGGIRKADGQPVFFSAEYDMDFEVIEEELRESYQKKSWDKNGDGQLYRKTEQERAEYVEFCVRRDMLQKRKFKLRLCEAGAMNRVLRMLLGIKQAYTLDELRKPFVMARIVFRPDFTDASVKQQFIEASIKAMTGVYGPTAAAAVPEKTEVIDVTPCPPEEPENGKAESAEKEVTHSPGPIPTEALLYDFSGLDAAQKAGAIERMSAKKGYDLKGFLARANKELAALTPERLAAMYKHLLGLEDKEKDDIPF